MPARLVEREYRVIKDAKCRAIIGYSMGGGHSSTMSGTDDNVINGGRALDKVLTSKGIHHQWVESPGYRHDYQIWRMYLRDLLPKLFRD